jgi:hypothetical protein
LEPRQSCFYSENPQTLANHHISVNQAKIFSDVSFYWQRRGGPRLTREEPTEASASKRAVGKQPDASRRLPGESDKDFKESSGPLL